MRVIILWIFIFGIYDTHVGLFINLRIWLLMLFHSLNLFGSQRNKFIAFIYWSRHQCLIRIGGSLMMNVVSLLVIIVIVIFIIIIAITVWLLICLLLILWNSRNTKMIVMICWCIGSVSIIVIFIIVSSGCVFERKGCIMLWCRRLLIMIMIIIVTIAVVKVIVIILRSLGILCWISIYRLLLLVWVGKIWLVFERGYFIFVNNRLEWNSVLLLVLNFCIWWSWIPHLFSWLLIN